MVCENCQITGIENEANGTQLWYCLLCREEIDGTDLLKRQSSQIIGLNDEEEFRWKDV